GRLAAEGDRRQHPLSLGVDPLGQVADRAVRIGEIAERLGDGPHRHERPRVRLQGLRLHDPRHRTPSVATRSGSRDLARARQFQTGRGGGKPLFATFSGRAPDRVVRALNRRRRVSYIDATSGRAMRMRFERDGEEVTVTRTRAGWNVRVGGQEASAAYLDEALDHTLPGLTRKERERLIVSLLQWANDRRVRGRGPE